MESIAVRLQIPCKDSPSVEDLLLHLSLFRRGLGLFGERILNSTLELETLPGYAIILSTARLGANEKSLTIAIVRTFLTRFLCSLKPEALEDYVFLNLFYPVTESLAVNLFRLTNVFDTTTEVWKTGKFQAYVSRLRRLGDHELVEILEALTARYDREILRQIARHSERILEYLLASFREYPSILSRLRSISIESIGQLLRRIDRSNYDFIDLIKDLRNVAVHGFSAKNLLLEQYFKSRFFKILKKIELESSVRDLFDLSYILELRMLLVTEYLQPAPNSSSEDR